MRNSKHGLKVLVLTMMAALGVMVFATAGAQAQTHTELLEAHAKHEPTLNPSPLTKPSETSKLGEYLINLGSALLATVQARQIGIGSLLVAARSLEIRCTGLELIGAKIDTATDALGEAKFTGCKAFDHKTLNWLEKCEFVPEAETVKAQALVLPILHGGENFLLFEPQSGTEFTNIKFKEGTECTLPLNNPVTGSVAAKVDALDAVVQLVLFSEGVQLLSGDVLRYGGAPSYIKAHGEVELTGLPNHKGQKLGIH